MFFRNACLLVARRVPLASSLHLVGRLLREIEHALADVLTRGEAKDKCDSCGETRRNGRADISLFCTALDIAESDRIVAGWRCLRQLAHYAHRDSMAAPRPMNDDFRSFWAETLTLPDVVLDRFGACFLAVMPTRDALLGKRNPKRDDARTLENNVPNKLATLGYLFGKNDNPAWREPLWPDGLLGGPPEPTVNDDEQTVAFPPWPCRRL